MLQILWAKNKQTILDVIMEIHLARQPSGLVWNNLLPYYEDLMQHIASTATDALHFHFPIIYIFHNWPLSIKTPVSTIISTFNIRYTYFCRYTSNAQKDVPSPYKSWRRNFFWTEPLINAKYCAKIRKWEVPTRKSAIEFGDETISFLFRSRKIL